MRNTERSFKEKEEDDNDYKKDEEDKENKNKNEDESGFLPFHGKILGNVWFFSNSTVLPLKHIWARER